MSNVELYNGDCLDVMRGMGADSVDTVLTDPPYGLEFMGKGWDHGLPGEVFWREALRVAKPGAMLLAFGGTRTFHRLTCAIEDAGWEIRDCLMWLYGSGFPKSHNIGKAIDKAAGALEHEGTSMLDTSTGTMTLRPHTAPADYVPPAPATDLAQLWHGYGTALKPAWEPVVVAMKPLDGTFAHNAEKHGVAGMWIDGGRVGSHGGTRGSNYQKTGLFGMGGNADIERIATGRWPANLVLDEDAGAMLDAQSGASRFFYCAKASRAERNAGLDGMPERVAAGAVGMADVTAKNWGDENQTVYERKTTHQNHHPTVKPLKLMQYLARLTKTPTGGVVLDPFMGSGTTGIAAINEGRDFIGIERDAEYFKIAEARIEHAKLEKDGQINLLADIDTAGVRDTAAGASAE